jgi:hypothetical protein
VGYVIIALRKAFHVRGPDTGGSIYFQRDIGALAKFIVPDGLKIIDDPLDIA